jgi:hypothetical protein
MPWMSLFWWPLAGILDWTFSRAHKYSIYYSDRSENLHNLCFEQQSTIFFIYRM